MHFGIFVLFAFLLCYRDWSVVAVAAGVNALHHVSFDYLCHVYRSSIQTIWLPSAPQNGGLSAQSD